MRFMQAPAGHALIMQHSADHPLRNYAYIGQSTSLLNCTCAHNTHLDSIKWLIRTQPSVICTHNRNEYHSVKLSHYFPNIDSYEEHIILLRSGTLTSRSIAASQQRPHLLHGPAYPPCYKMRHCCHSLRCAWRARSLARPCPTELLSLKLRCRLLHLRLALAGRTHSRHRPALLHGRIGAPQLVRGGAAGLPQERLHRQRVVRVGHRAPAGQRAHA